MTARTLPLQILFSTTGILIIKIARTASRIGLCIKRRNTTMIASAVQQHGGVAEQLRQTRRESFFNSGAHRSLQLVDRSLSSLSIPKKKSSLSA